MNIPPPVVRTIVLLALVALTGCRNSSTRQAPQLPPSAVRGNSAPLRPLAIPDATAVPTRINQPAVESAIAVPPAPKLSASVAEPAAEQSLVSLPGQGADLIKVSSVRPDPAELASTAQPVDRFADLRRILREAESRYARIDGFEARLTRREVMDGKQGPLEVIRYKFRKRPLSIHMKWIGTEGQGREVVYVEGKYEGKIHILTARGDMFPLSPTSRLDLAPDSDLVRSKSRHSIRDAGFQSSIAQLKNALAAADRNPSAGCRISYRGLVERPEFHTKMEALEEVIAPGAEALLPRGGRRTVFYDPTANAPTQWLPVLVITRDHTGREVEYYCFDRLLHPIVLDEADFDPDRLFKRR